MRGRIKVCFKSKNSLVVMINIQSQIEKQILSTEQKDNEDGAVGNKTKKTPHF